MIRGKKNTKLIAKNTAVLYVRMVVLMLIGLYTSRIVLLNLGVEDYGVYSAVGGIIIALGFFNVSMTSATQRFLNVALGKNDEEQIRSVFTNSIFLHCIIALFVLLLGETVGLWFLNNKMIIPIDRMYAANWVYQFSIAAFMVNIISVPYNAAIIANEKMTAFAYFGILESVLKLLVAFLLAKSPVDRLIFYAVAMFVVGCIIRFSYQLFCMTKLKNCVVQRALVNIKSIKEMLSFSVWTLLGALRFVCHTQGMAAIVNIFFGVAVNAALGVANQVNGVVKQFVSNFLIALNPQIVQCYAAGNLKDMHELVLKGGKIAFCLVSVFVVPLVLETPTVLSLWLKVLPEDVTFYVRMVLVIAFFDCVSPMLQVAKGATGSIRNYQIIMALVGLTHIPLMWIFFRMGFGPRYAMYIYLGVIVALQITRIIMTCMAIKLSVFLFVKNVVFRCLLAMGVAVVIPCVLHYLLQHSLFNSIVIMASAPFFIVLSSVIFVFSLQERQELISFVKKKLKK